MFNGVNHLLSNNLITYNMFLQLFLSSFIKNLSQVLLCYEHKYIDTVCVSAACVY